MKGHDRLERWGLKQNSWVMLSIEAMKVDNIPIYPLGIAHFPGSAGASSTTGGFSNAMSCLTWGRMKEWLRVLSPILMPLGAVPTGLEESLFAWDPTSHHITKGEQGAFSIFFSIRVDSLSSKSFSVPRNPWLLGSLHSESNPFPQIQNSPQFPVEYLVSDHELGGWFNGEFEETVGRD